MRLEDVIQKPLLTEKAARQRERFNEYCFAVRTQANKYQIRAAIEKFFKVKVVSVRTLTMGGKLKRSGRRLGQMSDWKKAFVRLREKETIQLFEGK